MKHPQIVPMHEISVDGRVWLKNEECENNVQLVTCRGIDAALVRSLLYVPTMPKQLDEMTLVTPYDLVVISMKGAHYAFKAHQLGESEMEVNRRVNFPRRMSEPERHLVILKEMKRRFEDMGEQYPKE